MRRYPRQENGRLKRHRSFTRKDYFLKYSLLAPWPGFVCPTRAAKTATDKQYHRMQVRAALSYLRGRISRDELRRRVDLHHERALRHWKLP